MIIDNTTGGKLEFYILDCQMNQLQEVTVCFRHCHSDRTFSRVYRLSGDYPAERDRFLKLCKALGYSAMPKSTKDLIGRTCSVRLNNANNIVEYFDHSGDTNKVDGLLTEVVSAPIMDVITATNGLQGGDAGHGGFTYLALDEQACTSWEVKVTDESGEQVTVSNPQKLEIIFRGDEEGKNITRLLQLASENLQLQGMPAQVKSEHGDFTPITKEVSIMPQVSQYSSLINEERRRKAS